MSGREAQRAPLPQSCTGLQALEQPNISFFITERRPIRCLSWTAVSEYTWAALLQCLFVAFHGCVGVRVCLSSCVYLLLLLPSGLCRVTGSRGALGSRGGGSFGGHCSRECSWTVGAQRTWVVLRVPRAHGRSRPGPSRAHRRQQRPTA